MRLGTEYAARAIGAGAIGDGDLMPQAYLIQDAFNGGELSPKMAGQVSFEKYRFGCSTLENFIALPQGPAQSRPGFRYVATAAAYNLAAELAVTTGGQNYVTAKDVPTSGGSGSGLTVDITAAAGVITAVSVSNPGSGYQAQDLVSVSQAAGTGGTLTVTAVLAISAGGSNYLTATGLAVTGGSGTAMTVNITAASGVITAVAIDQAGSGYESGDALTVVQAVGADGTNPGSGGTLSVSLALTVTAAGENYLNATGLPVSGGSGTGMTVDTTASAGAITVAAINSPGQNYKTGDSLTVIQAAGSSGTLTVLSFSQGTPIVRRFVASDSQAYILEFGQFYIRFYQNQAPVMSGASPYEVSTPYLQQDLQGLKFSQLNDVMYIWHPDYPPRKLIWSGSNNWSLAAVQWNDGPYLDETTVSGITLAGSAVTGSGIGLTASSALFQSGHAGALFRLQHNGNSDSEAFTAEKVGNTVSILGEFIVNISCTTGWVGTINLEISFDQVNWFIAATFTTSTMQDFYEGRTGIFYRLNCVSGSGGTANANLYEVVRWGVVQITSVQSPTQATANVLSPLGSTSPTPFWLEGAWSAYRGYPACACFRDGRLYAAGSPWQPTTVWGSWVGDFENMSPGDTADAPVIFEIADFENPILWLESYSDFLCGTMGEEVELAPRQANAISQTNPIAVNVGSTYGTAVDTLPIRTNDGIIFAQRGGLRVRLMAFNFFSNKYGSQDLTEYADHIPKPGIIDMAWQQEPYYCLWCARSDGVLVGLTYYPSQKVTGWHRHVTEGQFLSVATIPSTYGDTAGRNELWATVNRTINGKNIVTVELLGDFEGVQNQADYVCLDCAIIQSFGSPQSVITGLDLFDGASVWVQADGAPDAQYTVANGQITLDRPSSKVIVGLPYTCTLMTMDMEGGAMNGTSQGRVREVEQVTARLINSWPCKIGPDPTNLQQLPKWEADMVELDSAPPVFTGDFCTDGWPGNAEKSLFVAIVQDQPAPTCVAALVPPVNVNE